MTAVQQRQGPSGPVLKGTADGQLMFWDDINQKWNTASPAPDDGQSPVWDSGLREWTYAGTAAYTTIASASDFPAAVAGVITLPAGSYMVTANVNLGTDKIVIADNARVLIQGQNSAAVITSASTDATIELGTGSALTLLTASVFNTGAGADVVNQPAAETTSFFRAYSSLLLASGTGAARAIHVQGSSCQIALYNCIVQAAGTSNAVDLVDADTNGKYSFQDCTLIAGAGGACIRAAGSNPAQVLVNGGTFQTDTSGLFVSGATSITQLVVNGVKAEGSTALDFYTTTAAPVMAVFSGCDISGFTDGFDLGATATDLISIRDCHIVATNEFVGFTAASANTMIRSCTDGTALLTETAIVP